MIWLFTCASHAQPLQFVQAQIVAEQFDQWVFGAQRHPNQVRERLEAQLELRIRAVNEVCQLDEQQLAKLRLAGYGDMKRFHDDVEDVRRKFHALRQDQNALNKIWEDIQPLQTRFNAGIFHEDSLVQKVLAQLLDEAQSQAYEEAELQRRNFQYEAKLALVVALLEPSLALSEKQRGEFIAVLRRETQPALRYGQYGYYVVMFQAGRIPVQKLKPIFDAAQWQALQMHLNQARGLEPFLKQQGLLP